MPTGVVQAGDIIVISTARDAEQRRVGPERACSIPVASQLLFLRTPMWVLLDVQSELNSIQK